MKEYFLQIGESIQEGISDVGEKSQGAVSKTQEFTDIPGYQEQKQTVVDENQVNEAFAPANDAFSGLREAGDWLIDMISEFFAGIFGNLM